nr:hypothetical protein CFP56_55947 [Quercus suber]
MSCFVDYFESLYLRLLKAGHSKQSARDVTADWAEWTLSAVQLLLKQKRKPSSLRRKDAMVQFTLLVAAHRIRLPSRRQLFFLDMRPYCRARGETLNLAKLCSP